MSYELLLLSGPGSRAARERRRRVVQHAAERVPGAATTHLVETAEVVVGLVETTPAGGCWGVLDGIDGRLFAAVTTTAAWSEPAGHSGSREAGAERGHVRVDVEPSGRVSVQTDGVGMVPTFWGRADGLALSTHLSTLVSLGVAPAPDATGCLQYLTMLHPLDDRTILQDAKILPPGATLTWTGSGGVQLRSRPLFVPAPPSGSDDEAVETFAEVWSEVMADLRDRTAQRRVAVGLSGGLDSRAILVGAVRARLPCESYSFGTIDDGEVRAARSVAERVGVRHQILPVRDADVLKDAAASALRFDGAHSPALLFDAWFLEHLRQTADVIVNGHAGGPVWGDAYALGVTDPDRLLAVLWNRLAGSWAAVRPVLAPGPARAGEPELRASVGASLRAWDLSSRADAIMFWHLANRQRRWGNMLVSVLRRGGVGVETPFLDGRVLRHAAALSPEQHRNGRLYPQVHRALFPATAGVPRADDGNPPSRLNHLYWTGDQTLARQLARLAAAHPSSAVRLLARRGARELSAALRRRTGWAWPSDQVERRGSVFPVELWSRTREPYRHRLADLLDAGTGHHPLLQADALEQAALSLRRGTVALDAVALSKAATLGIWAGDHGNRVRELRLAGLG